MKASLNPIPKRRLEETSAIIWIHQLFSKFHFQIAVIRNMNVISENPERIAAGDALSQKTQPVDTNQI